jgi:hypothetical protein
MEAALAKMKDKVTQTESDLAVEREASDKLRAQLLEVSSSSVKRFLSNNSFKYDAQFAVKDLMKYTIYRELYKLTKLYQFTPKQIGFTTVTRESAIPSDISSFTWDEDKDELFDTEGKPIEKKPKIHSHNPTRIVYHWDPTKWPTDVNVPEGVILSTSDTNTPDVVEVYI